MKFKCYKVTIVDNLFPVTVYAAYRSPHPDQETVNEVNREMQTRNLDTSQMVDLPADHCPSEESSAAAGSSA